jgi:UDP-glucose 4-epimerase
VSSACIAGVSKFIYLSTAHVYARPLAGLLDEDTPVKNLHPYSTSKIAGEHAVLATNQKGLMQTTVLRLSNAFGAPMHRKANCWMLLVNDLCRQAVHARKLTLTGEGGQLRDFIPIEDVCRMVDVFVKSGNDDEYSGVFNIGTGKAYSALAMAQVIQECCVDVLGFRPDIECKHESKRDATPKLLYTSKRLRSLGLTSINADLRGEVSNLIKFCAEKFHGKSVK